DRIAKAGIRFDNAHVASPVCAPNRASWVSSRYPSVHGVVTNGITLKNDQPSFIEELRCVGYKTYGVGKMHLQPQWDYPPDGDLSKVLNDTAGKGALDPQPKPDELPYHGLEKCALVEDHQAGPYG